MKKSSILSILIVITTINGYSIQADAVVNQSSTVVGSLIVRDLKESGFENEAILLDKAIQIHKQLDIPGSNEAINVPSTLLTNSLVRAWVKGIPKNRADLKHIEASLYWQRHHTASAVLTWLYNNGVRAVANGDYGPHDMALNLDPLWVPSLRERWLARKNKYIWGSEAFVTICSLMPPGSKDVAESLKKSDVKDLNENESLSGKLELLLSSLKNSSENQIKGSPEFYLRFHLAVLYQQGNYDNVITMIESLNESVTKEKQTALDTLMYRIWIDSLWRSGRHKEAWRLLNSLTEKSASKTLLLLKAEYALHDGNIQEAKESLGFLAQYPENPAGQMLRARAAAEEGDVAEWLDAAIQTLFYSYGWEEDFFGQALAAGDLAIKRAKKR